MTFLHFAACAVCCFGPPVAVYKGTSLSDQTGTKGLLLLSSVFYLLTLFAKSLIVASFLPPGCSGFFGCSVANDILTAALEVLGINYLLFHRLSLSHSADSRLLCVGLGWALGSIVCSNANLLLKAIMTPAFQWADIFSAAQASVSLMCYITATALTFLASRRRFSRKYQIGLLLLAAAAVPWTSLHRHVLGFSDTSKRFLTQEISLSCWAVLLLQLAGALGCGIATLTVYTSIQKQTPTQKGE